MSRLRTITPLAAFVVLWAMSPAAAQYHTYPEVEDAMQDAADDYPSICDLHWIGETVQHKDMWALRITDNVGAEEDEPELKYISTMHGDEVMGTEMCLNLIDYLTVNYPGVPRVENIVDSIEIWIIPCMNPDGFVSGTRYNADYVDLNRDFPDPFTSPSNTPDGRAIETGNIMNWSFGRSFTLSANFHSGALLVNYPFDNNETGSSVYTASPDDDMFIWISEEYSQHNSPMWNSPTFYHGISNGADWYAISGGMQDWSYRYTRCNEVTIEIGDDKNPPSSQIPIDWNNNRDSMLAYIETCLIGIRGLVTDSSTSLPLAATVTVSGRDHDIYTDPDVGDYHRMLLPGTYTLTYEADGYDPLTVSGITVSSGDATRVDVALWKSTVAYPDGGETLPVGVPTDVTWTGSPTASFQVQYTSNFGDISSITDGFETGELDPAYTTGGHAPWDVASDYTHTGSYAAKSGDITHLQQSWMTRTVGGGDVEFWYRVSSESDYDWFNFYIDGDRQIHLSGTVDWTHYTTTLPEGEYELKWEYTKDQSLSSGGDAAWIDDLAVTADNTTWTDIIALTDPGATSTPWTPPAPGTDYKVRVRSYTGTYGAWDDSDETFTVSSDVGTGDCDDDGDVDLADFLAFQTCFTGPGGSLDPGCECADFNGDGDVDLQDFLSFQAAYTGPSP